MYSLQEISDRIKHVTGDDRISDLSKLQFEILDSDIQRFYTDAFSRINDKQKMYDNLITKYNQLVKESYSNSIIVEDLKSRRCDNCIHNKICFINTKVNQVAIIQRPINDFWCSLWEKK